VGEFSNDGRLLWGDRPELIEVMDFTLSLYVVVSDTAEIVHANRAMRAWLAKESNGLCQRLGRLCVTEPDQVLELRNWVLAIAAGGLVRRVLAIERYDDPPLILRGQAVDPIEPVGNDTSRRLAVISVHDALAPRSLNDISGLFELTCAERVLSEHIVSGASMVDTQSALGITGNTARTHLKSIYRKTGARSQADLVRLFKEAASISVSDAPGPGDRRSPAPPYDAVASR
jgi:DNA-binding CsgD family transcriptional regulator